MRFTKTTAKFSATLCYGLLALTFAVSAFAKLSDNPVTVKFSLAKHEIVQGEPLVLHYELNSRVQIPIVVELGRHGAEWISITAYDAQGIFASVMPDYRQKESPYGGLHPLYGIRPRQALEGEILVNSFIQFDHPGDYEVRVKVHLGYNVHAQGGVTENDLACADQQTLMVHVLPPDKARLKKIAEDYHKKSLNGNNVTNKWNAIKALFSMPEDVALPAWTSLLTEWPDNVTIEELTRLSTPVAAELLADIVTNPKWNDEAHKTARGQLGSMYLRRKQIANPALDAALTKIFLRIDGELPVDR